MRIWHTTLQAGAAVAIAVLFTWTVAWYLDVPVVHRSTATDECVRVLSPDDRYDCDTVPPWPEVTTWVP